MAGAAGRRADSRLPLILAFLGAVWLSQAGPAHGQALLLSQTPDIQPLAAAPGGPSVLRLRFSRSLDPVHSALTLIDPTGATTRLDSQRGARADTLEALIRLQPSGVYRLRWLVSDLAGVLTTGTLVWAVPAP